MGRGNVLDTHALSAAVQARRVGGAFLDVTEPEPLPAQHALWNLESVVVTSHTANTPRLGASAFEAYVRENVTALPPVVPYLARFSQSMVTNFSRPGLGMRARVARV